MLDKVGDTIFFKRRQMIIFLASSKIEVYARMDKDVVRSGILLILVTDMSADGMSSNGM